MDKHLADAVLVLPPFYFSHVTDVGLEHFLQSILEEAELPVYLYNFPVHTSNMFSVDTYKAGRCRHAAVQKPVYVIDICSVKHPSRSHSVSHCNSAMMLPAVPDPHVCECMSPHNDG